LSRSLSPWFGLLISSCQPGAAMPPLRFFVDRRVCDTSQGGDHLSVKHYRIRREPAARGLIHKRHELIREAGHRASDANATDVRTASNAPHPSTLGDVAVHNRAPTTDLYKTSG